MSIFGDKLKYKFKINGLKPLKLEEYHTLSFDKQIEYRKAFDAFKARAKTTHVGQKRKTNAKAIREFIDLYNVDEYFCSFYDSKNTRDDSFEVWYTTKSI